MVINTTTASGTGLLTSATGSTTPVWDLHIDGSGSGGSITLPNTFFSNSTLTTTFDVNNAAAIPGSGNQNNVINIGASPIIGATVVINVTGGNGYGFAMGVITTNNGATLTNTFNPTSASLAVAGYTGSAAGTNTLDLDGTNTGNQIAGLNLGSLTTLNVIKSNTSTWVLSTANTYNGTTTITGGILSTGATGTLADGATASSIGVSSAIAANLVINGATLRYANTGSAESTNRLFTIGTSGATLDASGANPITFSGSGLLALSGANTTRTFTLTGSGAGSLNPIISDNGSGATSLTKSGNGVWTLLNINSYTGPTLVSAGTLNVAGATSAGSAFTVNSTAFLTGTGTIAGAVSVAGGISPGTVGTVGTLKTGALTLTSTTGGTYDYDLNANTTDLLQVTGTANISNGALSLASVGSHTSTKYVLLTATGGITGTFSTITGSIAGYQISYATPNEVDLLQVPVAAASIVNPVTLATIHVGGSFSSTALSISNTASPGNENLAATFGTLTGRDQQRRLDRESCSRRY